MTLVSLSVKTMASNLTTQVLSFAQVSAAAMEGDFTRFNTVEASGEMNLLKTQINQMVNRKNIATREAAEWADSSEREFLADLSNQIRWVFLCS